MLNTSGHRIGTAEIEAALGPMHMVCDSHRTFLSVLFSPFFANLTTAVVVVTQVSESAVVGIPHSIKGEGIACIVILKEGFEPSKELDKVSRQTDRHDQERLYSIILNTNMISL